MKNMLITKACKGFLLKMWENVLRESKKVRNFAARLAPSSQGEGGLNGPL